MSTNLENSQKSNSSSKWVQDIPDLQIYDICTAYESGYGKGLKKDNNINPYPPGSPSAYAYVIGFTEGYRKIIDE